MHIVLSALIKYLIVLYALLKMCRLTCEIYNMSVFYPTNYKETDTKLFLHVTDLAWKGFQNVATRIIDTEVLVLTASLFHDIDDEVNEL